MSLQFEKPVSVSSSSDGFDTLTLKIKDSSFFTDIYGYQVDSKVEISADIPPQLSASEKAVIDTGVTAV